jgi:tetrapyrrole methylase family protein/MazG family protein
MRQVDTKMTIVGLGPGDAALLTQEAREALAAASEVWLRTERHPAVAGLPAGPAYRSFDDVYERGASFEEVYGAIVARVIELGRRPEGVVYAVPGHPLFGEATVRGVLAAAREDGTVVRIIAGMSFADAAAAALAIDPLEEGLLLVDGMGLAAHGRGLMPERPALVAQLYDRRAASQAKLALLEAYPPEHRVRIVRAAGTAAEAVEERALAELDHGSGFDHLTAVYLPPVAVAEDIRTFEGLRRIVARLRTPETGCPWDLEQTHETLKRFLLEEAYETLEALDSGERARLAEEMGDLLMQIVLHAQVAEDNGEFTIEDMIRAIAAKLVRRHPHVFGGERVEGAAQVLENWEVLKQAERGGQHAFDAVPLAMPALAQAQSLQSRAEKAGTRDAAGGLDMLRRLADEDAPLTREEIGEALFAVVARARRSGVDAEEALRMRLREFRERAREGGG